MPFNIFGKDIFYCLKIIAAYALKKSFINVMFGCVSVMKLKFCFDVICLNEPDAVFEIIAIAPEVIIVFCIKSRLFILKCSPFFNITLGLCQY